jgi:hypothetical protein
MIAMHPMCELGRRNFVKKLSCLRIFRSVPLRLLLLIAMIGFGGNGNTRAAPPARQSGGFANHFSYRFVAGSSLHSADYSMRQDYQSGACVSVLDTGLEFLNLSLQLPDGARIDYLRVYYYDTDGASNGIANIRKYDGAGGTTEIASVSSSGSSGYGTNLSAYVGHVVDNANGGYVLNWEPMVTGSTMSLCGLRVAYRLPVENLFLPIIMR